MSTPNPESQQPLRAFTIDHFIAWGSRLVLDNGDPWEIEPWQVEVFEPILAGVREVWTIIPEANTKMLSLDTRLPTPEGWTTMLDVQIGDEILGSDGLPTRVTAVSEIKFGEDCYKVTFSDGASLIAGGDHLWQVEDAQDHYNSYVRSTRYMANRPLTLRKTGARPGNVARWRIQTAARESFPDLDLPIDPYVLGVWLGDGSKSCGRITNVDSEVWDEIAACGFEAGPIASVDRARTQTVYKLRPLLRGLGLLGNKHIPDPYLIASREARESLLEGLMDTDGCVTRAGQAFYATSSERLANDVQRLGWSLGHPTFINETRSVLNGVDYGLSYRVTIACDQRHRISRLQRKQTRLKARGLTCDHRRIVSIDRVKSVPCKCIAVDSPDSLYLAGDAYIPTHNTTMMAVYALYHCHFTPSPWVPIAASSRDQAEILARQAYQIIRATPGMEAQKEALRRPYKPGDGLFVIFEGYREIKSTRNRGRGIKVYAADATTGDGVIPTLALCDEGHRWPSLEVYRLWKGKLGKRGGQIVMISTAGEPGGEFEETRDAIRNSATRRTQVSPGHIHSESSGIVMNEWRIADPSKISDMRYVKEANPFSGITEESLQEEFNSPTTDLGEWKRLKCNLPARTTLAAVTETEWDKAETQAAQDEPREIPEGEHVDCGADVAWKHDTFAIAPLWRSLDGFNLLGDPKILTPPRDGSTMHPDEVKQAFMDINDRTPIDTVVIDMERAEDIAAWLQDELGIEVVDRTQSNAMAIEDYDAFMKGLRNGTLKHTGDPELRKHVMNAIARSLPGEKKRFDRPSQSRARKKQEMRVIDALTAAAMIANYAGGAQGPTQPLIAWR